MRGILIDPFFKSITEVTVDGSLESMYKILSPQHLGWHVDVVQTARSGFDMVDVWVDEEGLFNPDVAAFMINSSGWLAGKGLLLGFDLKGETTDCDLLLTQVASAVTFP